MSIQVELSTIGEVTGEQLARRVPLVSSLRVRNVSDRAVSGAVLVAVDGGGSPTEVSFEIAPGEELLRLGVDVDRGDVDDEVLVVTAVAVSDGAVVGSAGGAVLRAPDAAAGENPESGGRFHRFRRSLSRLRGRDEAGEADAQPESTPDTSEQVADAVARAILEIQRRLDAESAAAEHAEREAAERAAAEREAVEREAAERAAAAREAAEREAARLAAEAAQHEADENARRETERAEQERVAREAAERAERERVERAAAEEAARDAAERAAQEASEGAAREQAEEQARAGAAREAAERAERETAERIERERVIREAAEQVAREAAEREAAERAARAQAEQEAAQRAAAEAAEREAAAKAAQEHAERQAADAAARERAEQTAEGSLPAATPSPAAAPPRAPVEIPDRPAEPLPGELPFEAWDGGWRGGRIVLDNLTATANKRLVVAALVEGINGEGPIHIDRLTRLVCAAFETRKVTAARVTELAALIPKSTQASEDGAVLWPARRSPTEWDGFRGAIDTEPRASEHIPLRELANAMVALLSVRGPMSRTELFGVTRRVFGGKRVTPAVEARFAAALDDAAGQHRLTVDGDRVATI